MPGELVRNLRLVRCPKCKLLLPENPDYDVYECGECGTKLQAKKRKSAAMNSESSTKETDAASGNALNPISGGELCIGRERMVPPREDGLKAKATSSSSGECHSVGNVGRGQNDNAESIGDELRPFNLHDEELETELDIYKLSLRRRRRVSNKGGSNQTTHCEIEEINSGNMSSEGSEEEFVCSSDENGNHMKSTLVGVVSEIETIGSDSEVAEELNVGNLLLEGEEEELTSGGDGEYINDNKSSLVGANPEVEINGSGLEKTEEFSRTNLLQKRAEEESVSGSVKEDENKNKLSPPEDENPEMEIPRSDFEGVKELDSENLLVEEAEVKLISGSHSEDANEDKSTSPGASPEVEISKSDLEGSKESNNGKLLLKGSEEELMSILDGEYANNDELALGENLEVEVTGSNIAEELKICAPDGEDPKNDQSAIVGTKSDVDIAKSTSITKSSSSENFVSEKENVLHVTPDKVEHGASGSPTSSKKLQKHAQKSIHNSFENLRSMDTLDTTNYINPSSELSGTLRGFSKSPSTKTGIFHAYDGSLSSNDGMDKWFSIQHLDSFEKSRTIANSVSEERTRKGKGLASSSVYGDLRTEHRSNFSNVKHHAMKDSRRNQSNLLETTRHGDRRLTRTRRDEIPPRMPFRGSGNQSRNESSSLANQIHDEPYYSSSFLSHEPAEQSYQEKMKLLRMIHKLQDQLNRTDYVSRETNGRQSTGVSHKGKHISAYHRHDLHEGRFSHGLSYPRCNGRCSDEVANWHRRHNFSRTPYSDQATSSAKLVGHSCSHCYPKEWRFSADSSPCALFHHEELCRSCTGNDFFSSHHSYPSSPQWLAPSKHRVYSYETQSDDQKRRDHEVRRYLREKQHLEKQNYRPVAGGAPFVTCHKCLNLLRLPVDFHLSERGPHQLKCGECSEVLKLSLRNGSLVSYPSNALGRPSSGLNDQSKVI